MKKNPRCLLLAFFTLGLFFSEGCMTTNQKDLNFKIRNESPMTKSSELVVEGESIIEKNPSLSIDQRFQLWKLWHNSIDQINNLEVRSLQLRAVLLKDLMAVNYDKTEISLVKRELSQTEDERLAIFFKGVFETNHILGRWGSAKERTDFYQWYTFEPMAKAN